MLSNFGLVFIMFRTLIATLSFISCCSSFIVPNDAPTLLSVIYSYIPPVKLGADSRVGFGFRLGPHADFQTLIEIGPQEKTKPIGLENEISKRQSSKLKSKISESEKTEKRTGRQFASPKRSTQKSAPKKHNRGYIGKIEFTKVPGIDDVRPVKVKTPKVTRFSTDAAPTKFVIL